MQSSEDIQGTIGEVSSSFGTLEGIARGELEKDFEFGISVFFNFSSSKRDSREGRGI
jgi:hypothetical protein